MNYQERTNEFDNNKVLDELREDVRNRQKSGLPFIIASVFIWLLIAVVCSLNINITTRNFLVFCCSCPLMPIAMAAGKILKINIFDKTNPLGKLGFLFTMNQMIYLLIVMWAFRESPEKMVMLYAMVFGAHLLPYSWLYKNKMYIVSAVLLPIGAWVLQGLFSTQILATVFFVYEAAFAIVLFLQHFGKKAKRE